MTKLDGTAKGGVIAALAKRQPGAGGASSASAKAWKTCNHSASPKFVDAAVRLTP